MVASSLYSELVVVNGPGVVASGAVCPNEAVVAASMAARRASANIVFCIGSSWETYCFYWETCYSVTEDQRLNLKSITTQGTLFKSNGFSAFWNDRRRKVFVSLFLSLRRAADHSQQTAININLSSSYKRSRVGKQERDHFGDLLRARDAACGMHIFADLDDRFRVGIERGCPTEHRCVYRAGANAIDSDLFVSVIDGHRAGQP